MLEFFLAELLNISLGFHSSTFRARAPSYLKKRGSNPSFSKLSRTAHQASHLLLLPFYFFEAYFFRNPISAHYFTCIPAICNDSFRIRIRILFKNENDPLSFGFIMRDSIYEGRSLKNRTRPFLAFSQGHMQISRLGA